MATINTQSKMHWFLLKPGYSDDTPGVVEKVVEQAGEDIGVWIGQWYYYLYLHDTHIDLCRNQGKMGLSSPPEVIKHSLHAISDDDLEYAVQYESGGGFEPGYYRISPLIERKLRILFE